MELLNQIIKRARRRIHLNGVLSRLVRFATFLLCLLFVLAIIDRAGSSQFINWSTLFFACLSFFFLFALYTYFRFKVTLLEAANEIDSKFKLKDRIVSAFHCVNLMNPFADAVVLDASAIVKKEKISERLSQVLPMQMPKQEMFFMLFVAIAMVLALYSPQWNLWGKTKLPVQNAVVSPSIEQVEESINQIIAMIEQDQSMESNLEYELSELAALSENELKDPESFQHEALKRTTDLQKRLDEMLNTPELLSYEAMATKLKDLALPKDSLIVPLVAALKRNEFDKAMQEFERLEEQLKSDHISESEKVSIQQALQDLALQFEKLALSNDQLTSTMSAAGLPKALADNPEAAKKAIENAEHLNSEQKQRLLEMLANKKQASEMCKNMSKACKAASQGNPNDMSSMVQQMQALEMFKTNAEIAKQACQNAGARMCSKPGFGSGLTGGAGLGNGGTSQLEETSFSTVVERSPIYSGEGSIIAKQLFNGGLLTSNESVSQIRKTVLAEGQSAERAIIEEEVPKRYHDLLRYYFGQLEKMTENSPDEDSKTAQ